LIGIFLVSFLQEIKIFLNPKTLKIFKNFQKDIISQVIKSIFNHNNFNIFFSQFNLFDFYKFFLNSNQMIILLLNQFILE
jgi:hypothetical protein